MSSQMPEPPQPSPEISQSMHYFIGLGIGLIPPILAMIGLIPAFIDGSIPLWLIAMTLYLGILIASIVCLAIQRVRFIGYGLLTMVFVAPVVTLIACSIMPLRL